MAYNKRNKLTLIADIQTIVLEHTDRGVTQEWVYRNVIYPRYRISRTTFYNYLACPARALLKQMDNPQDTPSDKRDD
ncbi:MAG TPA: hypothetical protein H9866_01460 [Candidatus Tidjanibacter gallistercoris]|nr:hypothetical protein [Candidatus Tidjanibacter gallistercoris]